jgi:hypothetical protein
MSPHIGGSWDVGTTINTQPEGSDSCDEFAQYDVPGSRLMRNSKAPIALTIESFTKAEREAKRFISKQ